MKKDYSIMLGEFGELNALGWIIYASAMFYFVLQAKGAAEMIKTIIMSVLLTYIIASPNPTQPEPPATQQALPTAAAQCAAKDKSLCSLAAQAAAAHKIDEKLFFALIQAESAWKPTAQSPVGARGLGQVMPSNAEFCGLKKGDPNGDLYTTAINLNCSAKILKEALVYWDKQFPSDAPKAIAHALGEYNAGRDAVINRNALTAFGETQRYVQKITLAFYQ